MRARLLEVGLDWDSPRTGKASWANIIAAIESEPPWGPIQRATEPEKWFWYIPMFEGVQSIKEILAVANLQRGGDRAKLRSFKPAVRPWDEKTRKIAAAPMSYDEAKKDFMSRFA